MSPTTQIGSSIWTRFASAENIWSVDISKRIIWGLVMGPSLARKSFKRRQSGRSFSPKSALSSMGLLIMRGHCSSVRLRSGMGSGSKLKRASLPLAYTIVNAKLFLLLLLDQILFKFNLITIKNEANRIREKHENKSEDTHTLN